MFWVLEKIPAKSEYFCHPKQNETLENKKKLFFLE